MHLYITDTGMSLQTRNVYRQRSKGTKSGINWNSMFAFGNGTLYNYGTTLSPRWFNPLQHRQIQHCATRQTRCRFIEAKSKIRPSDGRTGNSTYISFSKAGYISDKHTNQCNTYMNRSILQKKKMHRHTSMYRYMYIIEMHDVTQKVKSILWSHDTKMK